jgi:uncharacterized protein YukE
MGTMTKLLKQLKKERDQVQKQLSGLNAAISAFASVYAGTNQHARSERFQQRVARGAQRLNVQGGQR